MSLVKKNLTKFIEAAILLTLGILIIIAGAARNDTSAEEAVSTVIGIVMLVVGGLTLVLLALFGIKNKASFAAAAVSSASLVGVGISLLSDKWAFGLIDLLIYVVPYVLICVGAVIILDAVFVLLRALRNKVSVVPAVLSIVSGAAALVLGFLCIGNNPVIGKDTQVVVFGIIVTVLAAVALLSTVVNASRE